MLNVKKILTWGGIFLYLLLVFSFVSSESENSICTKVDFSVLNATENHFLSKTSAINLFKEYGYRITGYPIGDLNLNELEELLRKQPSVKEAQVYESGQGILHIDLVQRTPLLRVINEAGNGFYIDREGTLMPLSRNYTARVLVANGYISKKLNPNQQNFQLPINQKVISKNDKLLIDLYRLSKFISKHEFWDSQLVQIYVNKELDFELVPRIGSHIIIFGKIDDMEKKFKKLRVFYQQGLKKEGWNKYKFINLKFDNQIVCTRK